MTATTTNIESPPPIATRLTLAGRVQGIGLRPAVARFARRLSLVGYVGNTHGGVEIHVEGPVDDVERFERELRTHLPAAAKGASLQSVRVAASEFDAFHIGKICNRPLPNQEEAGRPQTCATMSARVPTDVVVCDKCLAEVSAAANCRHRYPFTSCTDCGPRFSIIERMPYEREQTSMSAFPLCERCVSEYDSLADRRFHAQTNACPECGPRIWLRDAHNRVTASGDDAVHAAASAIREGCILALRGLGGYQLLVDATSQDAVERLRHRKQRRGKPLAVMVSSLTAAAQLSRLDETERLLLCSPAGPIVVAAAREDVHLASSVTGGLNTIGLMMPTTPVHWLLLNSVARPVVCTSANVEGDPLVHAAESAFTQLGNIADYWLEHDRPIRRPIDDSVVRIVADRPVALRLARGYAPLPLSIETDRPLIALGGHQKTSIALSNAAQSVLGPHVGDLSTIAARQRYLEQVDDLSNLYGTQKDALVCDQHPEYFTTEWAENQTDAIVHVQHHHAHIVAGMLEHGWLDRQVLGVAFDGTGYGTDGAIWGGEFLLATVSGFERVGHLRPFSLPGGERAVREPWRVATALVREAAGDEAAARLAFQSYNAQSLLPILQRPRLSPTTTSAGRLFDGVASLILDIENCQYEGQAAMLLESACDLSARGQYKVVVEDYRPKQLDWRPLVRQIMSDRAAGVSPGEMAMRFHRSLADAIFRVCRCYSALPVVIGGGVFQNRVLVELLVERFGTSNQPLGLPGMIPPNDGGLAAGQLAIAALSRQRSTRSCV